MPFMEYAGSYALYNYKLEDPAKGMDYDNIRLIRAFENGLDHTSSEAGFVLVHIDMVKHSGPLVSGTVEALDAAHKSREALNAAMGKQLEALKKINATVRSPLPTSTSHTLHTQRNHTPPRSSPLASSHLTTDPHRWKRCG